MSALRRMAINLPAPAKRALQRLMELADPLRVWRYRRRTGSTERIPPVALRARVGNPAVESFMADRHVIVAEVENGVSAAGRAPGDFARVLDFGCGCARVLAPLAASWDSGASFSGCDIDRDAIGWVRRHHPALSVEVNGFAPPLPYESDSFDLVYSVSVLTHLDEEGQFTWLRELRRVLAPGGLALVTIHGPSAFRRFSSGEVAGAIPAVSERLAAHGDLELRGCVFEAAEPSRWNALLFTGAGSGWGLTFHSHAYVRERWSEVFPRVEVLDRPRLQDVVLLGDG